MPKLRLHKGGRVEPVFPRSLIAGQIALLPRHLIGARVEARPCGLNIQSDWRWEAALCRQDRRDLPSIEKISARTMHSSKERNIIQDGLDEALCNVETRNRTIATHV